MLSFVFKYFSKHCTQSKVLLMFSATVATLHPVPPSLALQIASGSKMFGAVEPEGNTIGTRLEH